MDMKKSLKASSPKALTQPPGNEHQIQVAVVDWLKMKANQDWRYDMYYAIPNGILKSPAAHVYFEREGFRSGVPDLCIAIPNQGWHGLYIEHKYGKNKPSNNQEDWMKKLTTAGYCCRVSYSFEESKKFIEEYMQLPLKRFRKT